MGAVAVGRPADRWGRRGILICSIGFLPLIGNWLRPGIWLMGGHVMPIYWLIGRGGRFCLVSQVHCRDFVRAAARAACRDNTIQYRAWYIVGLPSECCTQGSGWNRGENDEVKGGCFVCIPALEGYRRRTSPIYTWSHNFMRTRGKEIR
jgi:hypothetical protein